MTKEQVLQILQEHPDDFVSGASVAEQLHISRTAVWKAIRQLKADGYEIEAVTNQGYRLLSGSDVLSAEEIRRYLRHPDLRPQVFPVLSSTNTVLKSMAAEDAPAGTGTGYVDLADVPVAPGTRAYLCGPLPFMRTVREQLIAKGVAPADVHYEVFGPDLWLAG